MKVFVFDLLPYGKHFDQYKQSKYLPYPLPADHFDRERHCRAAANLARWNLGATGAVAEQDFFPVITHLRIAHTAAWVREQRRQYRKPKLVLFSERVDSACGLADAAVATLTGQSTDTAGPPARSPLLSRQTGRG